MTIHVLKVLSTRSGRGEIHPTISNVTPNMDAAPFALAATSVYDSSQDGAPVAVQADKATTIYCDTQELMLRGVRIGDGLDALLVYPSFPRRVEDRADIWRQGMPPAHGEVLAMRSATMSRLSVKIIQLFMARPAISKFAKTKTASLNT